MWNNPEEVLPENRFREFSWVDNKSVPIHVIEMETNKEFMEFGYYDSENKAWFYKDDNVQSLKDYNHKVLSWFHIPSYK